MSALAFAMLAFIGIVGMVHFAANLSWPDAQFGDVVGFGVSSLAAIVAAVFILPA